MEWLEVVKLLLPAAAAWAGVQRGLAVALERANDAKASASAAHKRIDQFIHQRSNHGNT